MYFIFAKKALIQQLCFINWSHPEYLGGQRLARTSPCWPSLPCGMLGAQNQAGNQNPRLLHQIKLWMIRGKSVCMWRMNLSPPVSDAPQIVAVQALPLQPRSWPLAGQAEKPCATHAAASGLFIALSMSAPRGMRDWLIDWEAKKLSHVVSLDASQTQTGRRPRAELAVGWPLTN